MIKIKPQGKKLLVKYIEREEEVLESGIIIPGVANANLQEGEIVAVGVELDGLVSVGDIALYPEKSGVSQRIDGDNYLWLDAAENREQVWGIVPRELFKKDKGDTL